MFHLIWMLIIGLVVGWVAQWFVHIGHVAWYVTAIIGIVGSFVGGFIARLFSKPSDGSMLHPAGILLSIVGAVVLLLIWRFVGPLIA